MNLIKAIILLITIPLNTWAQVFNDNIENRRQIHLKEVVVSNTTNCTVQWSCVDERLTGKCIEYHNDQWFEFKPLISGTYYVNISQQKCRDVRGIQLVALSGKPCEPDTYKILACASLGTQDDLFVPLIGLKAGESYLLNIDGYLKDYCNFTLQVSGLARGLPVMTPPMLPVGLPAASPVVELNWVIADSLRDVHQCKVLRREQRAFRSYEVRRELVEYNTFGGRRAHYTLTDTLPAPGNYLYQIVAESNDSINQPVVLRQLWVSYSRLRPIMAGVVPDGAVFLNLPLSRYPRGQYLAITITNPTTGRLLRHLTIVNEPSQNRKGRLYAQDWFDAGIRQVAVDIKSYPMRGSGVHDNILLPLIIPTD